MFEALALLACGTFFGAAVYISIVQHPAALEAGVATAARFFPPMYRRAAAMQVSLALVGTGAALAAWADGSGRGWLVGAVLLVAVVPYTLIAIKPINDQLLSAAGDVDESETQSLLHRWGRQHAVRSALSGVAFLLFLVQK